MAKLTNLSLAAFLALLPTLAFAQAPAVPPVTASATGTTGAVVATISAKASQINSLCGFDVISSGVTSAITPITVTGLTGGTLTYTGIIAGTAPFTPRFNPCIQGSAVNTAIVITTTASGSATAVSVNAYGFTTY